MVEAAAAARVALEARDPLDGFAVEGDGVQVTSLGPRSIVSIAFGHDDRGTREAVERGLGIVLPEVGRSASSAFGGGSTLLGLQRDQWFALTAAADPSAHGSAEESAVWPAEAVREAVGDGAAVTDQGDAWAPLALEGPRAVVALERTCRLDLHPEVFPVGRVARTSMEHLATVILREGIERFVLLSPRSSAESFAHAMATSVRNVS